MWSVNQFPSLPWEDGCEISLEIYISGCQLSDLKVRCLSQDPKTLVFILTETVGAHQ